MSPFRPENRHLTLSIVAIVAALVVIGIGVQAYLFAQQNADRDEGDRAYAECLRDSFETFADDLIESARANRAASEDLVAAGDRKDRTLDRLLRVAELARRTPPRATDEEFDAALDARVAAQENYARVKGRTEVVREQNPYERLKVECSR